MEGPYSVGMGDFLVTDEPASPLPDMATAGRLAAIFLLYFITARIGLSLDATHAYITLIWPPSGIALAAFMLYGSRVWPAVFAAALLVNTSLGLPFLVACAIAAGNTLSPLFGAQFLRSYDAYRSRHPALPQIKDNFGVILAALLVPVATATLGAMSLWLGGALSSGGIAAAWETWWVGDMLGIMLLTPFILKWFNVRFSDRTRSQIAELMLVLIAVAATSYAVFWIRADFAYYLFLPLMWAALRTGQRGATLAVLLSSGMAVMSTLSGYGPFAPEGLLHLQVFLAVMASVLLVFSSAVEERRRVLETLEKRAGELEDALTTIRTEDDAKKEFIGILAHELRNPLATILSSIELIGMQGLSEETTPELLTTINERSRAMVRLLDDLLDISRISENKLKLHMENVPVQRFFEKLGIIVYPLMKRYGHDFSMAYEGGELYLRADPARLEQILLNLLANAARYTKTRGTLEVVAGREEDRYAFHIRDKGVGIPHGMLRRVFEPFFQVTPEKVGSEGIGVGLALTRELVELHGGTIEAKTRNGQKGSEFIVRIPLAEAVQTEIIPQPSVIQKAADPYVNAEAQLKRTFRILVVDDNEAASGALAQLLTLRGHTTGVAATGAEALEKALVFEPEVIFLDIGLPDMTGYEVAQALREQKKHYFIIALTGYGQEDDRERARKAGIDQHLTKPAGLKEIQAALRKFPRARANGR